MMGAGGRIRKAAGGVERRCSFGPQRRGKLRLAESRLARRKTQNAARCNGTNGTNGSEADVKMVMGDGHMSANGAGHPVVVQLDVMLLLAI